MRSDKRGEEYQQSFKARSPNSERTDDHESVEVCVPDFLTRPSVTESIREPSSGPTRRQRAQRLRRVREKNKNNDKRTEEHRPRLVRFSTPDLSFVDLLQFKILPRNGHRDGNHPHIPDVERDDSQIHVIHNITRQANFISPRQRAQRLRRDRERNQLESVSSDQNEQSGSVSKYCFCSS